MSNWRDDEATIDQLRSLSAFGIYDESKLYLKGEASDLINEAKSSKTADYDLVDQTKFDLMKIAKIKEVIESKEKAYKEASPDSEDYREIEEELYDIEIERIEALNSIVETYRSKEIETVESGDKIDQESKKLLRDAERGLNQRIKKLLKSNEKGYLNTFTEEINEKSREIIEESEYHKEEVISSKEFHKDRIDEFQMLTFGPGTFGGRYMKKPTKQQLSDCLAALDKQRPDWEIMEGENSSEKALVSTLLSNFPDLAKKNAPLHELAAGKGSGCIIVLLPFITAAFFGAYKMLQLA